MKVNQRAINKDTKPYIIAELSANHGGDIKRAKDSITVAAKTGVSAIKIQTYTPDTMTINSNLADFVVTEGLWSGRTLYELYSEAYTPFEWHEELFKHAKNCDVTLFSTPFDESAVDLLESLDTPAYKIASFEIVDLPLIKYVASKNKPIFMSTGMASKNEIEDAVRTVRENSSSDLLLFHCISSYPAITEDSNLNNLTWLREKFGVEVGLSDHTTDNIAAVTAIGMGAVAIEKHFKLDNEKCGPDSSFSLSIDELSKLTNDCNNAWTAKGTVNFNRARSEDQNMAFRRSIYFVKSLKKGQKISKQDIKRIRPGFGLPPKYFDSLIGREVAVNVNPGDAVTFDVLSGE
ncbi:pseudaminic acid synthase [Planktomarina sp.]|nr:pseudaminic acid synthase [Planktomarina sp.]